MQSLEAVTDLRSEARKYTACALKTLVAIMLQPESPPAPRVAAANTILDRGWGKPQLNVEANHNHTLSIASEHIKVLKSLAELKQPPTIEGEVVEVLQHKPAKRLKQAVDVASVSDLDPQPA
jgi:hypothetical protein